MHDLTMLIINYLLIKSKPNTLVHIIKHKTSLGCTHSLTGNLIDKSITFGQPRWQIFGDRRFVATLLLRPPNVMHCAAKKEIRPMLSFLWPNSAAGSLTVENNWWMMTKKKLPCLWKWNKLVQWSQKSRILFLWLINVKQMPILN